MLFNTVCPSICMSPFLQHLVARHASFVISNNAKNFDGVSVNTDVKCKCVMKNSHNVRPTSSNAWEAQCYYGVIYSVSQKTIHLTFDHNFGRC